MTAVEARDLVKNYPGWVRALDCLSLTVRHGEVFGLLGPNGAGKSTTIKILTTLTRPDGGTATVAGHDALRYPDRVRRRIGVVSQKSGADPTATGRDNLVLQGHLYGLRGAALTRRVAELVDRLDLGAVVRRPVRTYSGGTQRRLDVALGLVHRPEVLFLDEPTTRLDPAGPRTGGPPGRHGPGGGSGWPPSPPPAGPSTTSICATGAAGSPRPTEGVPDDRARDGHLWMTQRRLKALLRQPGVLAFTLIQP